MDIDKLYKEYTEKLLGTDSYENCPIKKRFLCSAESGRRGSFMNCGYAKKSRFGELKRKLSGITNTMLSNVLKELEETQIIKREQFNEITSRVEYSLTQKGEKLAPVFMK